LGSRLFSISGQYTQHLAGPSSGALAETRRFIFARYGQEDTQEQAKEGSSAISEHETEHKLKSVPSPGPDALGVMQKPAGTPGNDTVLVRGCRDSHEATYVCGGCGVPLLLYVPPSVAGEALLLCNNCGTHNAPEAES
jgi:hypothetical protein